jgi:D-3-phosphoglycerate dehydrogenase / 2-oxoglutarate reductase
MRGQILVTDSLFISDEHVRQIEEAGYSVERLDKPRATEDELCSAIVGKVGYVLGGVEEVTDRVVNAADKLKVIAFTGAGFAEFIPGYEIAREKGIAITAAKGANASAVAELAIAFILMATRRVPQLTNPEGPSFVTVKGVSESVLGVVGYGDIGRRVAEHADRLGYSVLVCGRKKIAGLPTNFRQVSIDVLCKESDVVTLHVDKMGGHHVLGEKQVKALKVGAAVVNVAFRHAIDEARLVERLKSGEISLLCDQKIGLDAGEVPAGMLVQTNSQSGYNTFGALKSVSDRTTRSLLNVLETGKDDFRVI